MFFRKNKNKNELDLRVSVVCANADHKRMKIFELPLKEDSIIKKSIELYDDPSPCYIHKNAASVVLFEEIRLALLEFEKEGKKIIKYEEIPEWVKNYLEYDGIYEIRLFYD